MQRKEHHVVPSQQGGWDVKRDHASRASKHFETKREAIDWGRGVSQKQRSEFIIHNKDGKISGADSHGNEPFPPKG